MMEHPGDKPEFPVIDADLMRQFAENQSAEIQNKRDELAIRAKEIENTHEYSLELLKAQLTDRQEERRVGQSSASTGCFAFCFIATIVALCGSYALYLGKDAIVMEIVKALVFLSVGGLGGYSWQKTKGQNDSPKE